MSGESDSTMRRFEIVVMGGGPAGAATALGLCRLGYQVALVAEPRPFAAIEGISERVVAGLRGAGFESFVDVLPDPSRREVNWDGVTSDANSERLIDRPAFDLSLWRDLERNGVALLAGRVRRCTARGEVFELETHLHDEVTMLIEAGFVVEARGRAAPAAGARRLRGAETVSLLHCRKGPPGEARSAVQSHSDGWAWMASRGDGWRYLQLTFDVAERTLPRKKCLQSYCEERLRILELARPFVEGSKPVGIVHARSSTPILCRNPVGRNWIRVGDAAMAVDPLSGNGVFQALSSAMQAPAVINTMLRRPQHASLARNFHRARVDALFHRFARIGRDFCRLETRWADRPFWSRRRAWPDAEPAHAPVTPERVQIREKAVIDRGFIVPAEVVVTPADPLGVWHVGGHAAAPLLRALRELPSGHDPESVLASLLDGDAARAGIVLASMREKGWVRPRRS